MRSIMTLAIVALLGSSAFANTTWQAGGTVAANQSYEATVVEVTTGTDGSYSLITLELDDGSVITIDNSDGYADASEHGAAFEKAKDNGNCVTIQIGRVRGDLALVTRHRSE